MPLFQCPKCGRQFRVPLALCEAVLENTPFVTPEGSTEPVFVRPCLACMSEKVHVVQGDLLDQDVDVNNGRRSGAFGIVDEKRGTIFLMCLFYAIHMVEEFSCGFVPWGDRYFGNFDWTQNLIGNAMFFACLAAACYLYYRNPAKYLWVGMAAAMWILANSLIHISATILGREYSPGVVTATIIYVPGGLYFLGKWGRKRLLTWKNTLLSFIVGGMLFMLVPTLGRAIHFHAQLAKIFHLAR